MGILEEADRSGDARALPLAGVRVCDFTWIVAGPQATRILADLGADVVKVENESYLDSMRLGLQVPGAPPSVNGSGFHSNFNRNKLGITANLHHPKGREAAERLIAQSDIVIENFRPGKLEEWGMGFDRLSAIQPGIILVRISGYGQTDTGPTLLHKPDDVFDCFFSGAMPSGGEARNTVPLTAA